MKIDHEIWNYSWRYFACSFTHTKFYKSCNFVIINLHAKQLHFSYTQYKIEIILCTYMYVFVMKLTEYRSEYASERCNLNNNNELQFNRIANIISKKKRNCFIISSLLRRILSISQLCITVDINPFPASRRCVLRGGKVRRYISVWRKVLEISVTKFDRANRPRVTTTDERKYPIIRYVHTCLSISLFLGLVPDKRGEKSRNGAREVAKR